MNILKRCHPLHLQNNALSAAEFYTYQLLWDREHHTTTQADRQFWEKECLKIWIPQPFVKFLILKAGVDTHTHTHTEAFSLCTLTVNQSNRGCIHVSTDLNTKENIWFKRLEAAVNVPNCVTGRVRRCAYTLYVWVAGWHSLWRWSCQKACCLDSV